MSNALIVFVKNPVLGKVKTRLARTIGNEKALAVYRKLLEHTHTTCRHIAADKFLFCSDEVVDITWKDFETRLQLGADLGEKMYNAFSQVINEQACKEEALYEKTVIIGSDCYELTTQIIHEAFRQLDGYDVVIGPATDGGYYLLGMKKLYPFLFQNKTWSTDKVLAQILENIRSEKLTCFLLPVLNDVDEERDVTGTDLLE